MSGQGQGLTWHEASLVEMSSCKIRLTLSCYLFRFTFVCLLSVAAFYASNMISSVFCVGNTQDDSNCCNLYNFIIYFFISAFDIAYLFCFILRELIAYKPSGFFMRHVLSIFVVRFCDYCAWAKYSLLLFCIYRVSFPKVSK